VKTVKQWNVAQLGLPTLRPDRAVAANRVGCVSRGHIAHNIKGSGAQLGGRRLAMSCDRLEETAITGGLSHSPDDLADVERDYAELRDALTEQRLSLDKQLPGGPRA
jgi:hypothetical protein